MEDYQKSSDTLFKSSEFNPQIFIITKKSSVLTQNTLNQAQSRQYRRLRSIESNRIIKDHNQIQKAIFDWFEQQKIYKGDPQELLRQFGEIQRKRAKSKADGDLTILFVPNSVILRRRNGRKSTSDLEC